MTDVTKDAGAATNTNALDPTPPENNSDRFKGFATKDGEVEPSPAAKKDTNGKTPAAKTPVVTPAAKADDEGEEGDEGGEEKPRRSAEKRIGQAVARQRAAERRADISDATSASLLKRLEALEARATGNGNGTVVDNNKKGATSDSEAPKPTDFEYGELDARYISALARYEARKEFRDEQAKATSDAANARAQASAKERAASIEAWKEKAPAELDDFDEIVVQGAKDGLWPLSETVGTLLLDSPVGHQIAYALASDPKEAKRVASLSPARQAAWFGKEEARLTAEAESQAPADPDENTEKPKVTKAPAPAAHRAKGSGSSTPVSADTNDFAAFERLAQKTG